MFQDAEFEMSIALGKRLNRINGFLRLGVLV